LRGGSRRDRPRNIEQLKELPFLRKEVIQPHLPIRLPCYDFVPLTGHTFGTSLSCELGQ
jgi:hypothetical protein